jgi:hypothetical protein
LNLSPGQAYGELQTHTPEQADFSGAATARPHFFNEDAGKRCPFCNASKNWFASFRGFRIYGHPCFGDERERIWAALSQDKNHFDLSNPTQTPMEIFSEWLDELKQKVGFENPHWQIETILASIAFFKPSFDWDKAFTNEISKAQLTPSLTKDWSLADKTLQISTTIYGDALIVDHLISRALPNSKRPGERRLSLEKLMSRLHRIGYLKRKEIRSLNSHEAFEQAVLALVASSPPAVYYAVDRKDYLRRLKIIYKRYTE